MSMRHGTRGGSLAILAFDVETGRKGSVRVGLVAELDWER